MGENDNDTYTNINRVNYDFDDESFTDISDEAKDFISKLLLKDKEWGDQRRNEIIQRGIFFSKRLSADQCLSHSWLTRRPRSVTITNDEESAEKKISTKKLRRFVIRRRWQVKTFVDCFFMDEIEFSARFRKRWMPCWPFNGWEWHFEFLFVFHQFNCSRFKEIFFFPRPCVLFSISIFLSHSHTHTHTQEYLFGH